MHMVHCYTFCAYAGMICTVETSSVDADVNPQYFKLSLKTNVCGVCPCICVYVHRFGCFVYVSLCVCVCVPKRICVCVCVCVCFYSLQKHSGICLASIITF